MSLDQILALTLFAFAGTFTPGPNTAIVLAFPFAAQVLKWAGIA